MYRPALTVTSSSPHNIQDVAEAVSQRKRKTEQRRVGTSEHSERGDGKKHSGIVGNICNLINYVETQYVMYNARSHLCDAAAADVIHGADGTRRPRFERQTARLDNRLRIGVRRGTNGC